MPVHTFRLNYDAGYAVRDCHAERRKRRRRRRRNVYSKQRREKKEDAPDSCGLPPLCRPLAKARLTANEAPKS